VSARFAVDFVVLLPGATLVGFSFAFPASTTRWVGLGVGAGLLALGALGRLVRELALAHGRRVGGPRTGSDQPGAITRLARDGLR
jgi:hypothetical protein